MTTIDAACPASRTRIDAFINAVGGVRIDEPGADLAVLLAIVSSFKNKALPAKHVVFGEVGLAGEVRRVHATKMSGRERLREAAELGMSVDMRHALRHVECLANPSRVHAARWEHAIVPKANKPKQKIEGLEIFAMERVEQAVEYCRR